VLLGRQYKSWKRIMFSPCQSYIPYSRTFIPRMVLVYIFVCIPQLVRYHPQLRYHRQLEWFKPKRHQLNPQLKDIPVSISNKSKNTMTYIRAYLYGTLGLNNTIRYLIRDLLVCMWDKYFIFHNFSSAHFDKARLACNRLGTWKTIPLKYPKF